MAEETFHIPEQNIEYHIVRLLEKLEGLRCEGGAGSSVAPPVSVEARVELRSLELWRAVICECLATFFYVVVVCGAAGAAGAGAAPATMLLAASLASGLAAATLTHCFRHISGSIFFFIIKTVYLFRKLKAIENLWLYATFYWSQWHFDM